jgi:hypothetical protein
VPDGHKTVEAAAALTVSAPGGKQQPTGLARVRAFVHSAHAVGGVVAGHGIETASLIES